MELQASVLKVDIFDIWVAAIGLRRIVLWLFKCQSPFSTTAPQITKTLTVGGGVSMMSKRPSMDNHSHLEVFQREEEEKDIEDAGGYLG